MAQAMRAILLANATAATLIGRRSMIRVSQSRFVPCCRAYRMTAIAPATSSHRKYRLPCFEIPPSRSLPPVECCLGTSPIQGIRTAVAGELGFEPKFSESEVRCSTVELFPKFFRAFSFRVPQRDAARAPEALSSRTSRPAFQVSHHRPRPTDGGWRCPGWPAPRRCLRCSRRLSRDPLISNNAYVFILSIQVYYRMYKHLLSIESPLCL